MSRKRNPIVLNHANPSAFAAWLADITAATDDVIAVALDQVAPPARRDLGRRQAKQIARESEERIAALLAEARRGLPDDDPPTSDPVANPGH